jgi:hypothetical protein
MLPSCPPTHPQAADTLDRTRSGAQDVYETAKDTAHRNIVKPVSDQ